MLISGATVEKKRGYSSSPSSSTRKSGISLLISQTVFQAQIFSKFMLMGHFGPPFLLLLRHFMFIFYLARAQLFFMVFNYVFVALAFISNLGHFFFFFSKSRCSLPQTLSSFSSRQFGGSTAKKTSKCLF